MRDLYHNIKVTQLLDPVVATSTQTSSAIDMQGFESAVVSFHVGQSGDTLSGSVYWTLKLQHSDDDSDYTDVTDAELNSDEAVVTINDASQDEAAYSFGYAGGKRYIRAVATASGTHGNGTPMGITAIQGTPSYSPAN